MIIIRRDKKKAIWLGLLYEMFLIRRIVAGIDKVPYYYVFPTLMLGPGISAWRRRRVLGLGGEGRALAGAEWMNECCCWVVERWEKVYWQDWVNGWALGIRDGVLPMSGELRRGFDWRGGVSLFLSLSFSLPHAL